MLKDILSFQPSSVLSVPNSSKLMGILLYRCFHLWVHFFFFHVLFETITDSTIILTFCSVRVLKFNPIQWGRDNKSQSTSVCANIDQTSQLSLPSWIQYSSQRHLLSPCLEPPKEVKAQVGKISLQPQAVSYPEINSELFLFPIHIFCNQCLLTSG